jgi:catechol 2,3-dioxygenase-like lactoylglutathione lyase family enzyme
VTHYSRLSVIVIDAPPDRHDAELAFWQGATGKQLTQYERHPEYHGGELHGEDLGLLVQRLDDGPGRVHLDIHTDDLEAEVARLEALGAEQVRRVDFWCVLRDPAGLLFCVVPEPQGSLDASNAQRWD